MWAGNSEGVYGRCDAKCHEAKEPDCHCICGGRYHGRGSSEAAIEEFTRDVLGEDLVEEFRRNAEAMGGELRMGSFQPTLVSTK
jgi:hypothetical protein